VRAGVRQVQGTINGLGERCGNANMISLIPNLVLKMGFETGTEGRRAAAADASVAPARRSLNVVPNRSAAYVGTRAFAHKGGLHVSAVEKDPKTYEHVDPRSSATSASSWSATRPAAPTSWRASARSDWRSDPKEPGGRADCWIVKERWPEGYAYDGADASFRIAGAARAAYLPDYFALQSFRVLAERRVNARGQLIALSEADGEARRRGAPRDGSGAKGNGP
jgi:2-isopropylmalate synthase